MLVGGCWIYFDGDQNPRWEWWNPPPFLWPHSLRRRLC